MTLTMRVTKIMPRPEGVAHEEIVLHKIWVGLEDSPRGLEELACLLIEADLRSGRDYSAKDTFEMESRMTVALRAIQAATAREAIAPEDVALLLAWASPENRNGEPDELACLVIETELLGRKNYKARAAAGQ